MNKTTNNEISPFEAYQIVTGQSGNPFAIFISNRLPGKTNYLKACHVLEESLKDYEKTKCHNLKVEDSDEKIKAFNLVVEYEINIRFFKYCCDKRRGLQIFNQGRIGAKN